MGIASKRSKGRAIAEEPELTPRARVGRFITSHDAGDRALDMTTLRDRPREALDGVFAVVAEQPGHDHELLTLALNIAQRLPDEAPTIAAGVFRDEGIDVHTRLFALEFLVRRGASPPWRELEATAHAAWTSEAPRLAAACLSRCEHEGLSRAERARFIPYLTGPMARRRESADAVVQALMRVEPLLAKDVLDEHRALAFEACFDLLQHDDAEVGHRALDTICQHCPLDWIERLRFVPRTAISPAYLERLHGLVNRLWLDQLDLLTLSPSGFEHFVHEWLRVKGYVSIKRGGEVHDGGVDLEALGPDGKRTVVQCKRWNPRSEKVRRNVARELMIAAEAFHAQRALFVTTTTFTQDLRRNIHVMNEMHERVELVIADGPALLRDMEVAWGARSVIIGHSDAQDDMQLEFEEFKRVVPVRDPTGRHPHG